MKAGKKGRGRLGVIGVFIAIAVILAVVLDKSADLRKTLDAKRWELEKINDSIADAEAETEDIKTELKYRQTDDYVEDAARDLGLRYPDEIILVPEEDEE